MLNDERDKPRKSKESKSNKVMPLKDWHIVHNEHDIRLVKGVEIEVPKMFHINLKTEQVIK